ncbi:hypothetical protein H4Q26_016761 [Puccinia striiformis f. sp. tritici PST-130]|nr:hypothetical protein H4Q26_016761 [Puccinia striiformis f. sp. tritici PST-130]
MSVTGLDDSPGGSFLLMLAGYRVSSPCVCKKVPFTPPSNNQQHHSSTSQPKSKYQATKAEELLHKKAFQHHAFRREIHLSSNLSHVPHDPILFLSFFRNIGPSFVYNSRTVYASLCTMPIHNRLSLALEYLKGLQTNIRSARSPIHLITARKSPTTSLPNYVTQVLGGPQTALFPRTGFAVSGGGLRATLYSLGVLSAFEGKNQLSIEAGTGGLLNAADYISGLSGGAWTVVGLTYSAYDLATITNPGALAHLLPQFDLFSPGKLNKAPGSTADETNKKYVTEALTKMSAKHQAGFRVTIADMWGFSSDTTHLERPQQQVFTITPYHTVMKRQFQASEISMFHRPFIRSNFQQNLQPYPIITALGSSTSAGYTAQKQPSAFSPITSNQYEFTPFETGSWDSNLASFIPTEILGSRLKAGVPIDRTKCANRFDQTHFLAGISSDIFPMMNTSQEYFFKKSDVHSLVQAISDTFGATQPGISIDTASVPNPFFQSGKPNYPDNNSLDLRLLDGGLDGAVTPYYPLLVPARQLDVIVGVDAVSLDNDGGDNYSTGASLMATYARASLQSQHRFPKIPTDKKSYLALRSHPNFFGCEEPDTALLVWLPNSAPLDGSRGITNSSINRVQYEPAEASKIISAASEIGYRGFPNQQLIKIKNIETLYGLPVLHVPSQIDQGPGCESKGQAFVPTALIVIAGKVDLEQITYSLCCNPNESWGTSNPQVFLA